MARIESSFLKQLRTPKTFWDILRSSDINAMELINHLNELYRKGVIHVKDNIVHLVEDRLSRKPADHITFREVRCNQCGIGYSIASFGDVYFRFKGYFEKMPENIALYDQGSMRCEDIFKRVSFIYDKGDLHDNSILIMGDDDLICIAIGMIGQSKRIMVLEVDERLVKYIQDISAKEGLDIDVAIYNAEDEIPSRDEVDVFISDPVESLAGIKTFLSRGISQLVRGGRFYFGLTHIDSSPAKWMEIESMLLNSGCIITDIIRDFAFYPDIRYNTIKEKLIFDPGPPPSIWYSSSLIRGVKLEDRVPKPGKVSLGRDMYEDEETVTVR